MSSFSTCKRRRNLINLVLCVQRLPVYIIMLHKDGSRYGALVLQSGPAQKSTGFRCTVPDGPDCTSWIESSGTMDTTRKDRKLWYWILLGWIESSGRGYYKDGKRALVLDTARMNRAQNLSAYG